MGTEILRPNDPLAGDRLHATTPFHRRRNLNNLPNLIVDRGPYNFYGNNCHGKNSFFAPKPDGRRRESSRKTSPTSSSPPPHATFLRRGEPSESLGKVAATNNGVFSSRNVFNNQPLKSLISPSGEHRNSKDRRRSNPRGRNSGGDGPESPEFLPGGTESLPSDDVYAGSAFSLSPSPKSVPLPSFFGSNKAKGCDFAGDSPPETLEDSATIGLRRLLRLE